MEDSPDRRRTPRSWRARVTRGVRVTEELSDKVLEDAVMPAWRHVTDGESRWPVSIAVITALVLQLLLPATVQLHHRWILPTLSALLLAVLTVANPRHASPSTTVRALGLLLIASLTVANMVSAGRLVNGLVHGRFRDAQQLLLTGGAIWATNVIVFALWYWEFDRGGPAARMRARRPYPDFVFVQIQNPELAPSHWAPNFIDYLYVSFTNASAFSPTDVLPLTRWAKLTMMLQSSISLMTVALVVARAVNIL